MNKNNARCDVHMYLKKPNVEFLFLWLQFLRDVMCFHPTLVMVWANVVVSGTSITITIEWGIATKYNGTNLISSIMKLEVRT